MDRFFVKTIGLFIFSFAIHAQTAEQNKTLETSSALTIKGTKISISGVDDKIKNNILSHLRVEKNVVPLSAMGFPRSDNFIINTSQKALQAVGYYQPIITLTGDHQEKQLVIQLKTPVTWRTVNITHQCNNMPAALADLINKPPFIKNTIIHHGQYDDYKALLLRTAQESGLLQAKFTFSQLTIDIEQSAADIQWALSCGPRYTINKIIFDNSAFSKPLIYGYLKIAAGDYYQQAQIIASQQALNRSGFFQSVLIEQTIDDTTQQVDLTISAIETDKYELKTLLGYGTDSGGKLGIRWKNRRVNKRAHNYIIGLDLTNVKLHKADINATFQYRIPLNNAASQWINRASYQIKNEELGRSQILTVESLMINQLSRLWSSQWSLTLAQEKLTTDIDVNDELEYLVPAWQINYYSVEDPFTANTGWRWQSLIRFSTDEISDPNMNFVQTDQRLKSIWALGDDYRLLVRGRVAATWMDTTEFNQSMPSNYRFFAGGDISVRGYAYQSLSPEIDGDLLGGKHLLSSSIEVDYLFKENYRVALFSDQGNAFNYWNKVTLQKSVGAGIRWVTPIGAIRLDAAKALDGNKGWRFHLTIGPDL